MKILYIAHCVPYPPDKGEKIRAFHQIRLLSKEHSVHVACLADRKEELKAINELGRYCASIDAIRMAKMTRKAMAAWALATGRPLSVKAHYSWSLARRIEARISRESFDVVLVVSAAMAPYAAHAGDIPTVIDFVDVDSELWRVAAEHRSFPFSWICSLEAKRLAHYEARVARSFQHSIFVSESEADLLRRRVSGQSISVVTNGVDADYFETENPVREFRPANAVFVGTMDYLPNIDAVTYFCRQILPRITQRIPDLRVNIVGRNPPRRVRQLAAHPGVSVTGSVPDVRPYLANATVAVAPFRIARGVQNKILEAMAMGLPVVGTSLAFQGLSATTCDGIRIADDPDHFANEVATLVKDVPTRRQCAFQARQHVLRFHRWTDRISLLSRILQEVFRRNRLNDPASLVCEEKTR